MSREALSRVSVRTGQREGHRREWMEKREWPMMENRAIGEMTMGEEGRRRGKGGKRKDRGARKKAGSMRGMERGAGGYLFCLAPLLNTQLPLLKETEQRALYLGVRVWPAYQRGPCSTLYQ